MKPSMKLVTATAILFLRGTSLFAQNAAAAAFPRLEPDPKALEYARRAVHSGGYTWMDLAEISLWASGADGAGEAAGKSAYIEQIRAAALELRASPDFPAGGREQAEYILGFMHKKLLKSYSLYQTRVDTLLSGGR
jgi:hypothetical protein